MSILWEDFYLPIILNKDLSILEFYRLLVKKSILRNDGRAHDLKYNQGQYRASSNRHPCKELDGVCPETCIARLPQTHWAFQEEFP